MATVASVEMGLDATQLHAPALPTQKSTLTPPTSEDLDKADASSDLSELDMDEDEANDDDDIGDIEPAYYYDGGKIPVFEPTMDQFRSFPKFIEKIDKFGMKSGIVKVVPPKEWRDNLQDLDQAIKSIKVKNPITQEFVGNSGNFGAYTQQNIEKQRSYHLPQWKIVAMENQPPAKRGERRKNPPAPRPKPARAAAPLPGGEKRKPGRPRKNPRRGEDKDDDDDDDEDAQVPPTPTSPNENADDDETPAKKLRGRPGKPGRPKGSRKSSPKPKGRQPKATTVAERRKYNTTDVADDIDEEAFVDFDYRFPEAKEFDAERCKELEETYWKTITYGTPMYGADMPGTLFSDDTKSWHVGRLENLLDVLGTKIPGVNTTYLYLGMWKATFAWHLEDVDLYSINYIHFGAPKQWYSISQEDARRFEAAMKALWPTDAKHCDQFLRHKTYLISPDKLLKDFGIKVNRLVHNEGEFVITYPYGYHSGYNLGYNCAESVNFATESWLNFGRIAKKCNCEADSVWVDVGEIERKMRGEPTPEWIEETDDEDDGMDRPPSPPPSLAGKKRGRPSLGKKKGPVAKAEKDRPKKKIRRIKIQKSIKIPCALCPNEVSYDTLLPTNTGFMAHRICALYTPETYITGEPGKERVCGIANIDKSRLDLKCIYCRSKKGACFQCSEKKCTRAYHATCALGAGVLVDEGRMPTWDPEGQEFWFDGYDFRCRFHRPKRPKHWNLSHVENLDLPMRYGKRLKAMDTVQAQYFGAEPFGGVVVENRPGEQSVLVLVEPDGDRVEVEWKWLLTLDPADSKRPKPSPDAKPLPESLHNDDSVSANNRKDGVPSMGDVFNGDDFYKWQEWHYANTLEVCNPFQKYPDLTKPHTLWYYLGRSSTEAKAQYTHDPHERAHNPLSNFLDTVRPLPKPPTFMDGRSFAATYPSGTNYHAHNAAMASQRQQLVPQPARQQRPQAIRTERPYEYKPRLLIQSKPFGQGTGMGLRGMLNSPVSPQVPQFYHSESRRTSAGSPSMHSGTAGSPTWLTQVAPSPTYAAPQAYQQPPKPSMTERDPMRAGYPYQSATYTQVHGPRSPVTDPRLNQDWARHRSPTFTDGLPMQRPGSQHSNSGPAPTAVMSAAPIARMSSSSSQAHYAASPPIPSVGSRPPSHSESRPSPYSNGTTGFSRECMPAAPIAASTGSHSFSVNGGYAGIGNGIGTASPYGVAPRPYSSGGRADFQTPHAFVAGPTAQRTGTGLGSGAYAAYAPRPSSSSNQTMHPSAQMWSGPHFQYQSPAEFERQVRSGAEGFGMQMGRFDTLMRQLDRAGGAAAAAATATAPFSSSTGMGVDVSPSASASPNGGGAGQALQRMATPPPLDGHAGGIGDARNPSWSPVRPEYSPLTDVGEDALEAREEASIQPLLRSLDADAAAMDWMS